MTIFRLAVILAFFWNLSIGRCLVVTHPAKTAGLPMHSTTLFATTKSTEPTTPSTARVALVFPSTKERFRNLTRAIEYSVVHDEYEEDSKIPENHIVVNSKENFVNGTLGKRIEDGYLTPKAMPFDPSPQTRRSRRNILSSISLWLYWLASKTKTHLEKLVLRLRKKGSANLGGTKRHYALLLASFVKGTQACLLLDPGAYHRAIVESAHHRTVASLSPSSLEGIHHVSALEGHALKWALRKRRQQQKQHG